MLLLRSAQHDRGELNRHDDLVAGGRQAANPALYLYFSAVSECLLAAFDIVMSHSRHPTINATR
jgi:hypothetical protein